MRKVLICMLALLMMLSAVLTGCGGGETDSETKPGETSSQPNTNAKPSAKPSGETKPSGGSSSKEVVCEHEAVVDAAVAATCTANGKTEGSHCAKCGKILVAQKVAEPAKGHDMVDGKCSRCGKESSTGLKYSLIENDSSYSVSGIGSCTDTDIVIPSTHPDDGKPITKIEYSAFSGCAEITGVTIPSSVTSIGWKAFLNCTKLAGIVIENDAASIGASAFSGTAYYNDESNWENKVLYIGRHLIKAKTSLSGEYSIKEGTVCIAADAFFECKKLTGVTVPDSVISIGEAAFLNSAYYSNASNWEDGVLYLGKHLIKAKESLSGDYSIKEGTVCVADYAFERCALTGVRIPNSVTHIGNGAFSECKKLADITVPNGVVAIGNSAFHECKELASVTVSSSVLDIGTAAFSGCTGLARVNISDLAAWCNIDFESNDANPLYYAHHLYLSDTEITDLVIPDGVTDIKNYAFNGCTELASVTVPESVESIGAYAFYNCAKLASVTYTGTQAQWPTISKGISWKTRTGDFTVHCTDGDIAKKDA